MTAELIEHNAYEGADWKKRPDGNRILIVGHSHHTEDGDWRDYSDFTIDTVEEAAAGLMQRYPFFANQPRYLKLNIAEYWKQVALINFCPDAVDKRYRRMSADQKARGKIRLERILSELKPTHAFILTPNVNFGHLLPITDEERSEVGLRSFVARGKVFYWGTYSVDSSKIIIVRLRHPQGANTEMMQEAFSKALELPHQSYR